MNNKIFKIFVAAILMGSLTACNDWLDVEPSTEMDRNELFQNEDGFADAMSGVYATMISDGLYGKNLTWWMLELMGGGTKVMYGTPANFQGFYFHPLAESWGESAYMPDLRYSTVDVIWNEMYNAVANLNSLLECIDEKQSVFVGDDYQVFKGEALGLRAFLHFELLRMFSDAPTSADYSDSKTYIPYVQSLTSNVYPLLTVKQCSDCILKDLKEAKELLKYDPMYTNTTPSAYVCDEVTGNITYRNKYGVKVWHNRRFHFNYYAAVATMARTYLWLGDKTNALACAKEVIDAPAGTFTWVAPELISNTQSTSEYVSRDRTFSTEHVFAMHITDLTDRTDGILHEGENSFNSANGAMVAINSDCFDPGTRSSDPRYSYLKYTFSYYGDEFLISTKYRKDKDYNNSYSPWSANRIPVIRLSEMYYIAAECEPSLSDAVEYLECVRRNRGLGAYPLSCSSHEELMNEIENEYRKEFIAEGQTFYYYKRLNRTIYNQGIYDTKVIEPKLFTFPRPENEDIYGGRIDNSK